MKYETIENPRRVYVVWGLILAGLLAAGVAGNVGLSAVVAHLREADPDFHRVAADRLLAQKDYAGAKLELDKALELAPNMPELYVLRGHLFYEVGQWEEAMKAYETAIATGSANPYLYGRVLWCLVNLKRYEEAAAFGRSSIEQGHGTAALKRDTADAFVRSGKPAEAIPFIEAALKDSPKSIDLMDRLVAAYRATGQQDKADRMQQRLAEAQTAQESVLTR